MSRGIGRTQRLALLALWQARTEREEERDIGIPLTELKRRISSDRSNSRRAIRNLTERGMIEEITGEEGERRLRLTSGGRGALAFASVWEAITLNTIPSKPFDFDLILRETRRDDLELPASDGGIPPWSGGTLMERAAVSECVVSDPPEDDEESHAGGEIPCSQAADLESPVNDTAISRALAWLEDQL